MWIQSLVCTRKMAALVNGRPSNWIPCHHGLKKGDSLSPFLFIIAADVFSCLISMAPEEGLISSVGNSWMSMGFKNLHFADDTLLFYAADLN